jgi:fatty-acyl-CoA synthase
MNVPLTPIRCLYRAVDLYGKKIGVVSGPSSFTYAQFGERCERLAAGLLSEGIRPGDRIAYISFWKAITGRRWFEPSRCRSMCACSPPS